MTSTSKNIRNIQINTWDFNSFENLIIKTIEQEKGKEQEREREKTKIK
jgi:hypothetical protein